MARAYVPSAAVAEEAVQECWLAVIDGLDGFEGRSSLRTWIFRILANTAMKAGGRERRSDPFSSLGAAADGSPSVDPDRFLPDDHDRWPGHWAVAPAAWPTPEQGLLSAETRAVIASAIERLPGPQRAVISLRDVEGWDADEVCAALEISPGNQRVLLHRARTAVRAALESYFDAFVTPGGSDGTTPA